MNDILPVIQPKYIQELLEKIFIPTLLKVVAPTIILVVIGAILLGIARKILPKKLALLAELVIKIMIILMIFYATKYTLQNITLPELP